MKLRRHHIPFLSPILHNLNLEISKYGIQKAFYKVVQSNGGVAITRLDPKLKAILINKRVILISNHPHEIEPFILISCLPSRDDVYVIINALFLNWMSNLNKHLIPVYIRHYFGNKVRFKLRAKLFWKLPFNNKYHSYKKAHQKNIDSIKIGSLKIDQGGLIVIFPGIDLPKWFNGIGYLLKQTTTQEPIYLVKAYITGTTKLDILRLIPGIQKIFPQINVTFAKAKLINNLRKYEEKAITTKLNNDYIKWRRLSKNN